MRIAFVMELLPFAKCQMSAGGISTKMVGVYSHIEASTSEVVQGDGLLPKKSMRSLRLLSAGGRRRRGWSPHWRGGHSSSGLDTAIAAPLRQRRAPEWADRRELSNR